MRGCLACLVLALISNPAVADEASPLGMSYLETKDLRLVYFDPLGYLTPHAVRTFTGSLAWQRRMFGWDPTEPVTILLKDLADYGGASATSMPRNKLIFDVAPLSHAFETYPASERLYSLMNHELIHVVQGDLADEDDRRWRRFFHGKVQAQPEHPETLLYSYLTVPRFVAPRWYIEGSAVFMETWMGGGLGRAQGGYDEMVFRAMVRDGARFPIRWASSRAARPATSRVGRTPTCTARGSSPGSRMRTRRSRWSRGSGGTTTASGTMRTSSARSSVSRSNGRGRTGSPSSVASSSGTSTRCACIRSRRIAILWPLRWARSRASISTKRAASCTARFATPAWSSTSAR